MAVGLRKVREISTFLFRCLLHDSAEVQMIENPQGFNRIGRRHARVFNHDHVIAILLFTCHGEVGRPGENLSS